MAKDKQKKHEAAGVTVTSGKMARKEFEKELAKLQVELVRLQTWVQAKRARVVVIFEGRDTAGKGGVISRITARTSPRVYRHVALPAPSDREKSQVYIQRYVAQFPAAGEIILFDRSWYNRAGVERVMGFCTEEQCEHFPDPRARGRAGTGRQSRHHPSEVLSGYQPGRAAAPVRGQDQRSSQALEVEPDGHRIRAAVVGLHGRLPAHYRGHAHARGALAHRRGRRQAPRPAESDPAFTRQHPLQEGRHRPAESPQGSAAVERRYRESECGPADPQLLLRTTGSC